MRLLIRCQVAAAAGRAVADAPRWRSTARNIETTRSESAPRPSDGAACASASANAARSAAGGRGVGHRTASMEPVRPRRRTSLSVSRPAEDPARADFCASWPCRKTVLIRYVACAASPCAQPLPGHTPSSQRCPAPQLRRGGAPAAGVQAGHFAHSHCGHVFHRGRPAPGVGTASREPPAQACRSAKRSHP